MALLLPPYPLRGGPPPIAAQCTTGRRARPVGIRRPSNRVEWRVTTAYNRPMGYLTGLREGIGSLATAVLATAAALAACSAEATPTQAPAQAGEQAGGLLLVSDLAVGENRLAFTILSPSGDLLDDARVHVRFFLLHPDGRDEYRSEADAVFRPVSELQPHLHADGSEHHHGVKGGIYTVDRATFDEAGVWEARFDMPVLPPTRRPLGRWPSR